MLTAIPTRYSGVQFRSRLEARWAAFFDIAGWRWQYEPIDLAGWIPDFRLVATPAGFAEQAREALAKNTGIGSGELTAVLQAKGWVK